MYFIMFRIVFQERLFYIYDLFKLIYYITKHKEQFLLQLNMAMLIIKLLFYFKVEISSTGRNLGYRSMHQRIKRIYGIKTSR